MTKNFTYITVACAISMLLIIGGVQLTTLPLWSQITMIAFGLVTGIICFILLIRILIEHNKENS